ncbi:MAG: helix-turn-helix transcriptional regulator [bacterium]|nr:helix-turn-helix transcriptional regulator [bacterium]
MKDNCLYALGAKIRFERIKRKLSQEELAEITGLSRRAISCIECGTTDPKYTTLLSVANALGITIVELLETKF